MNFKAGSTTEASRGQFRGRQYVWWSPRRLVTMIRHPHLERIGTNQSGFFAVWTGETERRGRDTSLRHTLALLMLS